MTLPRLHELPGDDIFFDAALEESPTDEIVKDLQTALEKLLEAEQQLREAVDLPCPRDWVPTIMRVARSSETLLTEERTIKLCKGLIRSLELRANQQEEAA